MAIANIYAAILVCSLCVLVLTNFVHTDTCKICICNSTTLSVNCSHTDQTFIPNDPFNSRTLVLNMSSTNLHSITSRGLDTYRALQVLDLYNTSLNNISNSAFSSLTSLKFLNLSCNEHLPMTQNTTSPILFSNLTSLIELKIYGNTGTYNQDGYPDKALSAIKQLSTLWIDGLTNSTFGEAFLNMTSLKIIMIPGDIIQPPWRFCETNINNGMLDNLVHITNFTMRKCGVRIVESDAFKNMKSLIHLDLSYNRFLSIECLSCAFKSLEHTQITVLVLNAIENVNKMSCGVTITRQIARTMSTLTTLKELHVEQNAINGFDRGAVELLPRSIEYVNAKRNEFEIGWYVFDSYLLENIKAFDMSYNFFADDTEIWHRDLPKSERETTSVNSCESCLMKEKLVTTKKTESLLIPHSKEAEHNNSILAEMQGIDNLRVKSESNSFNGIDNLRVKSESNSCNSEQKTEFSSAFNFLQMAFPNIEQDNDKYTEFMHMNIERRRSKRSLNDENDDDLICPHAMSAIPPGTIVANLPKNLEYIDLSHSKFALPIPEVYFNETNKLKVINASYSLWYCWEGPLHGISQLEYVDLSFNLCTKIGRSFFDGFPNLKYLTISKNFLYTSIENDVSGRILRNLTKLEFLDISNNKLMKLPEKFLTNQANLKVFNVSENLLTSFDIDITHMKQLDTIDLRENIIHTLSQPVRDNLTEFSERNYKNTKKPFLVNLDSNHIQCYCNNIDFLQWVYDHMSTCRFLDVTITQCMFYNLTTIEIKGRNHLKYVLDHLQSHCASYTSVIIGVIVTFCIILNIIVAIAVHRFRWKIRYWFYVVSTRPTTRSGYISIDSLSDIGSRYKYDIYIASAHNDRSFVLSTMKSRLENERIRLFVQDDDIVPGQNIYSMIGNAIHVSRAMIFIISEECERDKEWKIAMRMAHEESINRGQPMFFGIFIDHEPATPYSNDVREIRQRSYIDYPADTRPANEQTFWLELLEKISEIGSGQILSFDTRMHQ